MRWRELTLLVFALILSPLLVDAARIYMISLSTDPTYTVNETIPVVGSISYYTVVGGSPPSVPQAAAGVTVNLSLADANGTVLDNTTATVDANGIFTGNLTAPETAGTYTVRANYTYETTVWEGSGSIKVLSTTVDNIYVLPNKATYYASQSMAVTARAVKSVSGGSEAGVENYTINVTFRDSSLSAISSFACTTDAAGYCNNTLTAPASVGTYTLEANDYIGYTTVEVIPFDVSLSLLDDTATSIQTVYSPGESGKLRVRVTYNGTVPATGIFTFNGTIIASNGSVVKTITETTLNTSTYTGYYDLIIDGNYTVGTYTIYIDVMQAGGSPVSISVAAGENTVSESIFFKVQGWSMTVEKVSGFDHNLVAFAAANLTLKVTVNNLTNGTPITTLNNSNFDILLYSDKQQLASYNVTANDTYYLINFIAPSTAGSYSLEINATVANTTQSEERTIVVVSSISYATPANVNGELREIFDGNEYVYISVGLKNSTQDFDVLNVTLTSVRDPDGSLVSYVYNSNYSADINGTNEWRYNITNNSATKGLLKLDNPKRGGLYFVEVSVNGGTGIAATKFIISPYNVFAFPHGKDDTWGWRWQFGKTDTIYFNLTVTQAQHTYGSAMMMFESSYGGGMGGTGGGFTSENTSAAETETATTGAAMIGGASQNAVSGATINVTKLINDQTFEEVSLTHINWSCTKTDSSGGATCTIAPLPSLTGSSVPYSTGIAEAGNTVNWTGGKYHIIFTVTGEDNITSDIAHSGFEVRSFYINAMSDSWMNKPTDNLTFDVYMYNPSDTMFWGYYYGGGGGAGGSNGTGLFNGRFDVVKLLYHGGQGNWIWPPTAYNYTGALPSNKTITSSVGNFTLNAPTGGWTSGSYTAVLKGYKTDENGSVLETDYGEAWFEVRLWDVYANPVSINNSNYQWTSSFSTRDNVTLYINIHNAGSWMADEELAGGPVTVGVQKIMDFSSWPPTELTKGDDYNATTIIVGNSSPDMWGWGGTGGDKADYIINITRAGNWKTGFYNVVLDVNGTDTGWGYFDVISFMANAQFSDENGSSVWSSRGVGPVYFNVSSSRDYFGSDPLNTTVKSVSLSMWSGWTQTKYAYPGNLNVAPTQVNGSEILTISINDTTNWPSGSYNGQIELEDAGGETALAWIWFEVRPFVVSAQSMSWQVGKTSSINATIQVYDPQDWMTQLNGSYSITGIYEETYGFTGPSTRTAIENYTPQNFTQETTGACGGDCTTCNQTNCESDSSCTWAASYCYSSSTSTGASILISPNGGQWSSGYHNLILEVNDSEGNTGEAWLSFEVVPFNVNILNQQWFYGPTQNISVNITITDPMNASKTFLANISGVYEEDYSNCYTWPCPSINYTFTPTQINGTGELNITAPGGGWSSNWHSIKIRFTDPSDATSYIDQWLSFDSRPFDVQISTNGYTFKRNQNITASITVQDPSDWSATLANISRIYEVDWTDCPGWPCSEINYTFTPTQINGTGNLTVIAPDGGWSEGYKNLNLIFMDPVDSSITVSGSMWFEIASYTGSFYANTYSNPSNSPIDFWLYVYEAGTGEYALVNLTSLDYTTDWTTYTNATWTLINQTTGANITGNQFNGTAKLRAEMPDGGWTSGYSSFRVNITDPDDEAISKQLYAYLDVTASAATTVTTAVTTTTTTTTV